MFVFFSSRRRHTRYWRDWSSDVCSSDLHFRDALDDLCLVLLADLAEVLDGLVAVPLLAADRLVAVDDLLHPLLDRKSVVEGKRVDLGGRRIIKKKNKK